MRRHPLALGLAFALSAWLAAAAQAAPRAVFSSVQMTPETALQAAQAALASCRQAGYQVSVAVVDRSGQIQVLLRDRFAGAHTLDVAPQKAWTAASFRIPTAELAAETQPGRPMSGIRWAPHVMAIGGGLVIEASGQVVGAIGVSGAPGGEADDACALAGVKAVTSLIELSD
jgi:uncharacterized protein GlcG (DUF336 family)